MDLSEVCSQDYRGHFEMSYTLVRHSGYSVGGNSLFQHAVEEREVSTARQLALIAKAGGVLFKTYSAAHDEAFSYNYPPEVTGLCPRARGKFVKRTGFDEEIFIPD
jgi:hypothetical protein